MSDTHLQNLEKAMNIAYEAGEIDKATMMAKEIQSYSNSLPEKGITADSSAGEVALTALGNVIPDAKNLVKGAYEAVTSPVKTMEGLIDLSSAGVGKILDVTGLDKYADQEKVEKYRKYRGIIADEVGQVFTSPLIY